MPDLSIVVPVYNSCECVRPLVAAVQAAMAKQSWDYELILANDGSRDGSWEEIEAVASEHPAVIGLNLWRNFGQDNAIVAGFTKATGRIVVVMDDDLQHDPEDMHLLIREVEGGADICYGRFERKKQAWWKNLGSAFNDRIANLLLHKPADIYLSPYKAINGRMISHALTYQGPYPYVDGLLLRCTTRITQVDIPHHERYAGQSNYGLVRSISVWLKVATTFSLLPLRVATIVGFVFAVVGVVLAITFAGMRLSGVVMPAGWASLIVSSMVLGGIQLLCLGLIGEYIGRLYLHVNRKPQFIIRDTRNAPE